ncbi:tetraspanin-18-like [Ylistrum balloti]|uniref:tetraspanin-18-like n=1 Tax=Ylistrum balloti TaxID=509963 RepID=UPI002905A77F|nr:tetraspanin-18-like [Ylistrum balloti]
MSGSKSKGCMKTAIIVFNLIVFIAGSAVLALGIYSLVSDYGAKQLSSVLGNDLYHDAAYVSIAAGAAIAAISMCGCCGSIKESKCILGMYLVFMSFIFVVLLTSAVLIFIFLGQISKDAKISMTSILTEQYGVDLDDRADNRVVTDMWNFMQKQLQCCGISGGVNSTTSWAAYKLESKWYAQFSAGVPYVPESCCRPEGDLELCTGMRKFSGPPGVDVPLLPGTGRNPHMYDTGCYDEVVHYVQSHALIIGGGALAAVVIILFGIISGVCLCKRIKYDAFLT